MKSKELNEILNKTRRTPNISLTPEQVEELVKDLEEKEKQDKILNALLKNSDYRYDYDEWNGMRGNQCIMICISEDDECFEEVKELLDEKNK